MAEWRECAVGDRLIREGEGVREIMLLHHGQVECHVAGTACIRHATVLVR